jgi:hypothetical protein
MLQITAYKMKFFKITDSQLLIIGQATSLVSLTISGLQQKVSILKLSLSSKKISIFNGFQYLLQNASTIITTLSNSSLSIGTNTTLTNEEISVLVELVGNFTVLLQSLGN